MARPFLIFPFYDVAITSPSLISRRESTLCCCYSRYIGDHASHQYSSGYISIHANSSVVLVSSFALPPARCSFSCFFVVFFFSYFLFLRENRWTTGTY